MPQSTSTATEEIARVMDVVEQFSSRLSL